MFFKQKKIWFILLILLLILVFNVAILAEESDLTKIRYNVYYPYDCSFNNGEEISIFLDINFMEQIDKLELIKINGNKNIEDYSVIDIEGKKYLKIDLAKEKGVTDISSINIITARGIEEIKLLGSIRLEGIDNFSTDYIYNIETISKAEDVIFRYRNISGSDIKVLGIQCGNLNQQITQYDKNLQKWIEIKSTLLGSNEEIVFKAKNLNNTNDLLFIRPLVTFEANGQIYTQYDMIRTNYVFTKILD